jgi:hypothetical protein
MTRGPHRRQTSYLTPGYVTKGNLPNRLTYIRPRTP